jgi:hypothetical protein
MFQREQQELNYNNNNFLIMQGEGKKQEDYIELCFMENSDDARKKG